MTSAVGCQASAPQEQEGLLIVKLEEDCTWGQEISAQEHETSPETSHQCFRHFRYQQAAGPRQAFIQLQELCHSWLRPEIHSKEQILELLVLEQFLTILPGDIQTRVREQHPESGEEAVTLVEELQREHGRCRQELPVSFEDVAVYLSQEEWGHQESSKKALSREAMQENYDNVVALESQIPNHDPATQVEQEEKSWDSNLQSAKEQGSSRDSYTVEEKKENKIFSFFPLSQ